MLIRSLLFSPEDESGSRGGTGSPPSSSGATSSNGVDDDDNNDSKNQFVSRDAYERLQKDLVKFKNRFKEVASKNNEYESDLKQREEQKLLEEKRFQELIENQKKEIEGLKGAIGSYETQQMEAKKYSAFTKAVGNRIPDKFLPVIPLDQIKMVDGEIDNDSLKEVAGNFLSTYPEIFKGSSGSTPGDYPKGGAKKMSKAEYIAQGRVKGSKWMQQQIRSGNVDFG